MNKTVYILNGFAPEKLYYFNHRNMHGIKAICMDNNGDKYNESNFKWLMNNKIFENNKKAYVLITAEYQLDYLTKNEEANEWFKKNSEHFLTPNFYIPNSNINWVDNPNYLDKFNIVKILKKKVPEIVTQCSFMLGKDFNNLPKKEKLNKIAKEAIGAGSNEIHVYRTNNINEWDILENNKEYLIEDFIEQSDTIRFLEGTMLVTGTFGEELSMIIDYQPETLLHGEFGAKGTTIYHKDYWYIKDIMLRIQKALGITRGCYDPEFFMDINSKKIYLLDLNPRWAGYHSCMNEMASDWLPKNFDMLDCVVNEKSFYKTVEKRLTKLPLESKPMYLTRVWTYNKME